MRTRVEIFHSGRRPGWYWRLRAGNGRILAIGGEPFVTAAGARRSVCRTLAVFDPLDPPNVPILRRRGKRWEAYGTC